MGKEQGNILFLCVYVFWVRTVEAGEPTILDLIGHLQWLSEIKLLVYQVLMTDIFKSFVHVFLCFFLYVIKAWIPSEIFSMLKLEVI